MKISTLQTYITKKTVLLSVVLLGSLAIGTMYMQKSSLPAQVDTSNENNVHVSKNACGDITCSGFEECKGQCGGTNAPCTSNKDCGETGVCNDLDCYKCAGTGESCGMPPGETDPLKNVNCCSPYVHCVKGTCVYSAPSSKSRAASQPASNGNRPSASSAASTGNTGSTGSSSRASGGNASTGNTSTGLKPAASAPANSLSSYIFAPTYSEISVASSSSSSCLGEGEGRNCLLNPRLECCNGLSCERSVAFPGGVCEAPFEIFDEELLSDEEPEPEVAPNKTILHFLLQFFF